MWEKSPCLSCLFLCVGCVCRDDHKCSCLCRPPFMCRSPCLCCRPVCGSNFLTTCCLSSCRLRSMFLASHLVPFYTRNHWDNFRRKLHSHATAGAKASLLVCLIASKHCLQFNYFKPVTKSHVFLF
jgi:hypothetical protein